jgi:hypothetical protein
MGEHKSNDVAPLCFFEGRGAGFLMLRYCSAATVLLTEQDIYTFLQITLIRITKFFILFFFSIHFLALKITYDKFWQETFHHGIIQRGKNPAFTDETRKVTSINIKH